MGIIITIISLTRSYAALRAADIDWIVGLETVQAGTFWGVLNVSLRASGTQLGLTYFFVLPLYIFVLFLDYIVLFPYFVALFTYFSLTFLYFCRTFSVLFQYFVVFHH